MSVLTAYFASIISCLYNILSSETGRYACHICPNFLMSQASILNIQYFIYVLNALASFMVHRPWGHSCVACSMIVLSVSSMYLSA